MDAIRARVIAVADYTAANGATVRQTARQFGMSKSAVHKDLTERLPHLDAARYAKVRKVLDEHASVRHLRGGEATKRKWQKKKTSKK